MNSENTLCLLFLHVMTSSNALLRRFSLWHEICRSVWTCVARLFDSARRLSEYVNICASPCSKNTVFYISPFLSVSQVIFRWLVHLSQSWPFMVMMSSCRVTCSLSSLGQGGDSGMVETGPSAWPQRCTKPAHVCVLLPPKPGGRKHEDVEVRWEVGAVQGLKSCNASLKIRKVELSDDGIYRCFLPEIQSMQRSADIRLVVGEFFQEMFNI